MTVVGAHLGAGNARPAAAKLGRTIPCIRLDGGPRRGSLEEGADLAVVDYAAVGSVERDILDCLYLREVDVCGDVELEASALDGKLVTACRQIRLRE